MTRASLSAVFLKPLESVAEVRIVQGLALCYLSVSASEPLALGDR